MTTHCDIHDMPQLEVLSHRFNAGTLCALGRTVSGWLNRGRGRKALAEVHTRQLLNSGPSRSLARGEAAKPFWYAGQA